MELVQVVASQEFLNGVGVSPEGRIFVSCPRWIAMDNQSVKEVTADGSLKPFPGNEWNHWQPGDSPRDHIVSTHSIHADRHNNLWVVDDARPLRKSVAGGSKLVKIDLSTNQVSRVYHLGDDVAPLGAVLGHVRLDDRFAYITEHHFATIIVLDLETGAARRVLMGRKCMLAEAEAVPVIEGVEWRRNGKISTPNVDILELSPDNRWLYFISLCGPTLYRIETRYLHDASLSDDQLESHVEIATRIPGSAGMAMDAKGNFYLSSFTEDAMVKMTPDYKREILISDPRISFPNEPSLSPDGWLYFPASQAHRLSPRDGVPFTGAKLPFELFKIKLPEG